MANLLPANPPTQDKDRQGYNRSARNLRNIVYKDDLSICLTSRTESPTHGHLTPYFVFLPELTSISQQILSMAQAQLGCFKVPRSGVLKADLPTHANLHQSVRDVMQRLGQNTLYDGLLRGLLDIDTGVLWRHNRFIYDPGNVADNNMPSVAWGKFSYLTLNITVWITVNLWAATPLLREICTIFKPHCYVIRLGNRSSYSTGFRQKNWWPLKMSYCILKFLIVLNKSSHWA